MHIINEIKKLCQSIFHLEANINQVLFSQKKNMLEYLILNSKEQGITDECYCDHQIIVSLTTYGKRLHDVHLTIESIMQQTMKANKIILWLDNSFQNQKLPLALQKQKERGLEIKFCRDIRSYTKLIPALKRFPNDAIITIDDDLIYEFDLLEKLITAYQTNPDYIYCHRYHRMLLDDKGNLLPYNKWKWSHFDTEPNILNFPTGVGGVLYPPNSLDKEVFNEEVFMDICKYADDVWFKAMSMKNNTLSKKVISHNEKGEDYLLNMKLQDTGLCQINVSGLSLNDKQIDAVFKKYDLYDLLYSKQ